MPKIPSATRMGRALPSGQAAVVKMQVVDSGLTSFGEDLSGVARDIKTREMADRQGVLDEADIAMSVALENEKRAYDRDPDFGTIGPRSEESMKKAFGTIGGVISNPKDRARWEKAQQLNMERARGHLAKVAWVKQRDHGRAGINAQMEEAREMALTTDDLGAATAMIDRRLESAVAQNYVTAQEAEDMGSKFKSSVAVGRLEMMEPEDRIKALREDWAQNLPSDTRVKLERQAEAELIKTVAVGNVDALDMTASRSANQAIIDKIEDPDERLATEARYNNEKAAYDAGVQETQLETFDGLYKQLDSGAMTFDDIQPRDYDVLKPTQIANLRALGAAKATPRKVSDDATFDRATTLAAQGNWRGLEMHLANFGSNLNQGDREKFSTAAASGMAPSSVSDQQVIASLLTGDSAKEKAGRKSLLARMSNWRNDYKETYGKEPTQTEVEAEVKRRMKPVKNPDGGWDMGGTDVAYAAPDEIARTQGLYTIHMDELWKENPDAFNDTMAYMRRQNADTEDRMEVSAVYEKQVYINDMKARSEPEIQAVIQDVNEGFVKKGILKPTQDQWLDAVTKLAGGRRAAHP